MYHIRYYLFFNVKNMATFFDPYKLVFLNKCFIHTVPHTSIGIFN